MYPHINVILITEQPGAGEANMLVVADLDDIFLPRPTDLLINLKEARDALETLFNSLPDMFKDSTSTSSALGPALQAGSKLMVR